MDLLGQTSLVVGLTSFALGFSVLARNVRNKLYISFALMATLIAGWGLSFFMDRIWSGTVPIDPTEEMGGFYRLHLLFNIWIAPASLAFIRMMVRLQEKFSRRLLDLAVLGAMCLTVSLALHEERIPWVLQLIYFAPVVIVIQIADLMWIDRRLRRGLKRAPKMPTVGFGRRTLIYAGGLLVLSTSVMDHVPWMGHTMPAIGNILLTSYLFFLSQVVTQQRLLNFSALFSRFLVLVAVALTLTGVYSLLVAWIENSPGLFFLNSFIASFLILMLLEPLRSLVGYFTERLLTQRHRRLEQALREAQRGLTGVVEPGTLFQSVLLTVQQILQPEWAALFVLSSDGTRLRRARTLGHESLSGTPLAAPAPRELLVDQALLEYCRQLRGRGELPILLDQLLESEIDRSASRLQRERLSGLIESLKALESNLVIPFFGDQREGSRGVWPILGFLALRVPGPPEPWGSNWGLLPIIYPYFEHVARAMQNLDVFARSREKERLAALGEMAAGLAHEIRNPLGAIKGAAQFLDPSINRPESRFLRVIVEEVDRLNHVVTQFLDYSKPPNLNFKLIDLSSLAARTVENLRASLGPEGAHVSLEFEPSPGALVLGVSEQIQQVLVNLIMNSLKALGGKENGQIRVSIAADRGRDSEARDLRVVIQDNGCGIKKENLDKLFIPFFTTSPSGTGLGLSISQKIIEAHHGRIEVASEEGGYTRFSVILPAAPPAEGAR